MGRRNNTNDLKYEANKYKYDFQQLETIRCFDESIFYNDISISEAEEDQSNLLLKYFTEFTNKSKPKTKESKMKKWNTFQTATALSEGQELTLNLFKSKIFPLKKSRGKIFKKLSPKKCFKDSH